MKAEYVRLRSKGHLVKAHSEPQSQLSFYEWTVREGRALTFGLPSPNRRHAVLSALSLGSSTMDTLVGRLAHSDLPTYFIISPTALLALTHSLCVHHTEENVSLQFHTLKAEEK